MYLHIKKRSSLGVTTRYGRSIILTPVVTRTYYAHLITAAYSVYMHFKTLIMSKCLGGVDVDDENVYSGKPHSIAARRGGVENRYPARVVRRTTAGHGINGAYLPP